MAITVGWFVNSDTSWNEFLYSLPEPLELNRNNNAQYVKCPAVAHYCKNTFVIRSGFDIELRFDKETKRIKYVDGSIEPSFVKELLVQFHPNEWKNFQTPLFQFHLDQGFVADESVWVEIVPAFHNAPNLPGHILPGTFDIYSWQRMISFGFEWQDTSRNFVLKRGDPIYYVRFRSKDPGESFKLKQITMDAQLKKDVDKCQSAKFVLKNYSWNKLIPLNRLLRPRRYIK